MMRIYATIVIGLSFLNAIPAVGTHFSDDVLFRLYCINRIMPAIKIIKKLEPTQLAKIDKPILLMGENRKDVSVLRLWDDLQHYKYLDDATFFPYVLCRVLLVLIQSKKIPYSSKDLDGINVEDFLSAIDVVVSHANHINQHYHDSGLSFDNWLRQYWWIPTFVALSIFIKVLKYYYLDSHNDFSWSVRSSSKF